MICSTRLKVLRKKNAALLLAATLLAPSSCLLIAAPGPLRVIRHIEEDKPTAGRTLLVMLPGRGMASEEYEGEGFVPAIRKAGLAVDAVAVDAHIGYLIHRSLSEHLLREVILPARAAGYDQIWLLGISMGGIGALRYAQLHPGTVDGLILLAPFLGDEELLGEIEAAGGPKTWTPPAGDLPDEQWQARLWAWLKGQTAPADSGVPPITVGFGSEDRFARACELLGKLLPKERVFRAPGGHDWPPWRALFGQMVKAGVLGQ